MLSEVCLDCARGAHHACLAFNDEGAGRQGYCDCFDDRPGDHGRDRHAYAMQNKAMLRGDQRARSNARRQTPATQFAAALSRADQLSMLPSEQEAADTAVDRLAAREEDWLPWAERAIDTAARRLFFVTANDVWEELQRIGAPPPHDTRAMGAAMRDASRRSVLRMHDPSRRPSVWRSLVKGKNTP